MSKKPLFLMPYDGEPCFGGMVDDHRERHARYCQMHDYEFCPDPNCHDEISDWGWNKLFRLRHYLRQGKHSHIFWMDADIIVTALDADMRDTVSRDKWLAMVRHGGSWNGCWPWHYNTGVMYLYACPESLAFVEEACEWFYRPRNWQDNNEQTAIMDLLMNSPKPYHDALTVLHHDWNANWNDRQWNPKSTIVIGFHGAGRLDDLKERPDPLPYCARRLLMQQFAKENGLS